MGPSDETNDNELIDSFLELVPADEPQEVTAKRVGIKRPRMSKIILARRNGKDVRVHANTARRIEEACRELRDGDPIYRARLEGMRAAAEMMEEALDKVWAVVDADGKAIPPEDVAAAAERARQARQSTSRNGPRNGEHGQPPDERDVG